MSESWEDTARRYAENTDYWRNRAEAAQKGIRYDGLKGVPADQWNRIAAVVRAARREKRTGYRDRLALDEALDALTPDDIEAVQS